MLLRSFLSNDGLDDLSESDLVASHSEANEVSE
jgi:hypothetical protein